jgi:7-cyano-7-deazaguanine reductase
MTDYSKASNAKTETVKVKKLTTFPVRGHQPIVEWSYPEFQCLCPVSKRHDQGKVTIKYLPDKKILESKSVREYLSQWRNKKVWQEYVTEEIADTLYSSCAPVWLLLEIEWAPRGGIFAKTSTKRGDI